MHSACSLIPFLVLFDLICVGDRSSIVEFEDDTVQAYILFSFLRYVRYVRFAQFVLNKTNRRVAGSA